MLRVELSKLFTQHRIKSSINNKWKILMERVNSIDLGKDTTRNSNYSDFNKKANYFVIEDIFIKHYGFDAIIVPPYGKSLNDFRKLLPSISMIYRAEVIAEYSKTKSSFYMRCHLDGLDICDIDDIKFKWYKILQNNSYRNYGGETYTINKVNNIINKNSDTKEIVGYKLEVDIPEGLDFQTLKGLEETISHQTGRCLIKFNMIKRLVETDIILKPMSDDEKFKPIKLNNPWEFFLAVNYSFEPIISDLSKNPHLLYTGKTQTGKTVAVITGLTNLCYQFSRKDVRIFCSMISAKKDLRIFKNVDHCDYYAENIIDTLKLLKYLHKEMERRNKIFESSEKFCSSMYAWNKLYPNKKMPILLASFDEMTLYMPLNSDEKEVKRNKQKCIDLFKTLITESASSGINILFCLQRPDKDSFNPTIKAQIGTVIGFYQPNTASSLVAMDDESLCNLQQKREAIVRYDKGYELVKTLYLTNDMVEDILKNKIDKNHQRLILDLNGNIIRNQVICLNNDENITKTTENEPKIEENNEKVIDFSKKLEIPKPEYHKTNESRWQKYQKGRKDK
jgi:S-DNA-T family DNA segregation ATPase FtsK/SpoIIIE